MRLTLRSRRYRNDALFGAFRIHYGSIRLRLLAVLSLMGFFVWLAETALGAAIKGIWARFFPSKDEQLGELKQEVKQDEAVIKAAQESKTVSQSVDNLSDDAAVIELSKWRKD